MWLRSPSSDAALPGAAFGPEARGHVPRPGWDERPPRSGGKPPLREPEGPQQPPSLGKPSRELPPPHSPSSPGSPPLPMRVPPATGTSSSDADHLQRPAWARSSLEGSGTHRAGCLLGVVGAFWAGGAGALLSGPPGPTTQPWGSTLQPLPHSQSFTMMLFFFSIYATSIVHFFKYTTKHVRGGCSSGLRFRSRPGDLLCAAAASTHRAGPSGRGFAPADSSNLHLKGLGIHSAEKDPQAASAPNHSSAHPERSQDWLLPPLSPALGDA